MTLAFVEPIFYILENVSARNMCIVSNDARWMDVIPAPSLKFCYALFHSRDTQYMYVLPMLFFPPIVYSRVLAVFHFLVVLLFIEIHTKKWIKAPNFLAYDRK